jgi:predicted CoA-binding protein
LGEQAYPELEAVRDKVELVNIFRRSAEAGKHVDEAIRIGAQGIWLQEDVIDDAAARRALAAGLDVVMDRCLLKEHLRLSRVDGSL